MASVAQLLPPTTAGRGPCRYSYENAPIQKELSAREVGNAAAFLLSPLASAITGQVRGVQGWVGLCAGLSGEGGMRKASQPADAKQVIFSTRPHPLRRC